MEVDRMKDIYYAEFIGIWNVLDMEIVRMT